MLWVCSSPVSKTKFVVQEDLKTFLHEVTFLAWVIHQAKPTVIQEFDGFEGIGGGEVLGKVVSVPYSSESVEFGDALYVGG